jgi:hypothetical protein
MATRIILETRQPGSYFFERIQTVLLPPGCCTPDDEFLRSKIREYLSLPVDDIRIIIEKVE